MEYNDIKTYLDLYETSLKLKLGYAFSYRQFVSLIPKNPFIHDAIRDANPEEDFPIPWYEVFARATHKIYQIIDEPKQQLKYEPVVKLSSKASKVTNQNLIDTVKVPDYWKQVGIRKVPEKVYSDVADDTLCIYENRFIVFLVDRMIIFLRRMERKIIDKIKKLSETYNFDKLTIADINTYEDIQKFRTFYNIDGFCNLKTTKKDGLLSLEDSAYIDILKKVVQLRKDVCRIRLTKFYTTVKRDRPLSQQEVHATNILTEDKNYAPCYEFYEKLLKDLLVKLDKEEEKIKSPVFDPIQYHNFVVLNLIATLYKKNFTNTWPHKDLNIFFNRKNVIQLVDFGVSRNNVKVTINTCNADEVKIKISLKSHKAQAKQALDTLNKQYVSNIILKIIPNFDDQEKDIKKLKLHVAHICNDYLKQGYDNCFIVSNNNLNEISNLILASPFAYKKHHSLETALESSVLFLRGDDVIYTKICPVCGAYVENSCIDGNYNCPNCGTTYSVLDEDEDGTHKHTIWIKKFKETI